jgi:hypothetical protein
MLVDREELRIQLCASAALTAILVSVAWAMCIYLAHFPLWMRRLISVLNLRLCPYLFLAVTV